MGNYADFQTGLYFAGLAGEIPPYPLTFAGLEAAAGRRWSTGSGTTSRAGRATSTPSAATSTRSYAGESAADARRGRERDLSIDLFGHTPADADLHGPIGVLGVMTDDEHGDLATAEAAASSGVPMVASTLMQDPMEEVARPRRHPRVLPALHTERPRLAESFVRRAEAAGFRASSSRSTPGPWATARATSSTRRSRSCAAGVSPTTPPTRCSARVSRSARGGPRAAAVQWALTFGNPTLTWEDLAWLRELTDLPLLLKGICHPDDVRRAGRRRRRDLLLQPRRPPGGQRAALDLLPAVVDAAEGMPVLFDSGVRSGADVVKALALGATASASAGRTGTARRSAAPPASSSCSRACSPRPT